MTILAEAPRAAARPLVGILLVCVATLAFAGADVLTKPLATRNSVPVVLAVRFVAALGLLALLFGPRLGAQLWRTNRTGLVVLRGACQAIAGVCVAQALRLMPVGETVAIVYVSPFVVMLMAMPLLGERVGPAAWFGAVLGFIGVLCIARPGSGLEPSGIAWAIACAACATGYSLLTRLLAPSENNLAMLFIGSAASCVIFIALAAISGGSLVITRLDLALMVLLGAMTTFGHFVFTAAYRHATASMLAPISYLHLLWAGGLGWLVFDHLPDAWSFAGMALIFGSGAGVAIWSSMRRTAV